MKKARMALRLGGALAILLVLLALISCAESSKDPADDTNVTVEVRVGDVNADNGGAASRSLTATNESYKGVNELYWYYTAVKKDSYFTTGQVTEKTALNEGALGLPTDAFGEFSVGTWLFQFYAYEVSTESIDGADTVTIDGTTYYIGDLYYSGESYDSESYYTTLTTESNTVSVNVEYVGAESGTGCIVVYGITIKDTSGNEISSLTGSDTTYAVVTLLDSDGNTVSEITDSDIAVMAETEEEGLSLYYTTTDDGEEVTSTDIPVGYYGVTVTFYVNGIESATGTTEEDFLVQAGHTTTVTGDTLEVTVEAEIGDTNITYYTVSVSSEDELIEALAMDGATVVLTASVTLESYLTVTTDSTIDLNGNNLTSSSYAFLVSNGASLTITDDSDEGGTVSATYYPVYFTGTGGSLTVEGGTLSSTSGYAVLVYGTSTAADITISGGTISSANDAVVVWGEEADITITGGTVSSDNGAAIWVYSGDSNITISGGTLSAENDSAIYIYDGDSDITITGGDISGDIGLSILNTVDSADITISGGTITGSSYALTVNGLVTSETPVTLTVTDGEFNGLVYLAGYCTTDISGGTFTSDVMQALHMRSGSLNVTGGTFKGTHPEEGYDYEYIYAGGGSAALYGDIVVEASSGYPLLSVVAAGSAVSLQSGDYYGIHYYLDPKYSDTTPDLDIDTSLNYTAHTGLVYRREVTTSGYDSWRLYYSDPGDATATTYTVTISGTDYTLDLGDLEVQDSSSSTGWSTYSSSEE